LPTWCRHHVKRPLIKAGDDKLAAMSQAGFPC
jgi:hypothetical protein